MDRSEDFPEAEYVHRQIELPVTAAHTIKLRRVRIDWHQTDLTRIADPWKFQEYVLMICRGHLPGYLEAVEVERDCDGTAKDTPPRRIVDLGPERVEQWKNLREWAERAVRPFGVRAKRLVYRKRRDMDSHGHLVWAGVNCDPVAIDLDWVF